ncbi:beta-1,3-galactosyltransferase 2-like [Coregonus clupeaformis]|uniref:beta-1,3-galactosyltransferase 2-like n=1 Tax=Coregonus clupeaformis TaxID=59861 RepID=UPI001E1C69BD|nr:beta-1,3-galactosyltransferase 2-like [Coregonus clupeaformis]
MSPALMQSGTALSGRLYRRPCILFILVAVAVSLTYTTFTLNWWNDPQQPLVNNHTGKSPDDDDDQVNTRVLANRNGVQWEDPGRYHVAYPRGYKFVMDEPEKCRTGSQAPFLVLMVPVAPGNLASRDAIRRTWGNETLVQGKKVQTLFMLGLPGGSGAQELQEKVNQESRAHHDLLQSDFMDTYHNLTIKTMVILEWLVSRCPEASYAMKIDSDVFLNVQNLVSMLVNPDTPKQNYMTGLVWWHSPVLRNPNEKFFLPYEVIAESEYPPYPLGFGYIMSMDLPKKILGVSPQIKPIYIEDAYLGMCLKRLGISPTEPPSQSLFAVNPLNSYERCKLSTVVAVMTTRVSQLLKYWQEYTRPGPPC